jgi:Flp pilus assembly pilin Flp
MFQKLLRDEAGFIVSAELVLIATIVVIGLIVGLSEIQHSVVQELNDVGEAIGKLNQSYAYSGFSSWKNCWEVKSFSSGSFFVDESDDCDCQQCDLACDRPQREQPKRDGHFWWHSDGHSHDGHHDHDSEHHHHDDDGDHHHDDHGHGDHHRHHDHHDGDHDH